MTTATEPKKPRYMTFPVVGKIQRQRTHQGNYYTQVITPAADQYSMPSQIEVCSDQPLGSIDSEFKGYLRVSGFIKKRQYTDKNTGEVRDTWDRNVYFHLA